MNSPELCAWVFVKAVQLNLGGVVAWAWYRLLRRSRWSGSLAAFRILLVLVCLRFLSDLSLPVNLAPSDLHARPGMLSIGIGVGWTQRFPIHFLSVALELGHHFQEAGNAALSWIGPARALPIGACLLIWSMLSLAQFALENLRLWRDLRACRPHPQMAGVWLSPCLPSMAVGLGRPRVILNTADQLLPLAQQQALVAHELAHCSRRDPLKSWLLELSVRTLPYVLPLRWLVRQCRLYFEMCSDRLSVSAGAKATVLADLLCSRVRVRSAAWVPASVGSDPYLRISQLLKPTPPPRARGLVALGLVAATLILGTHIL